MPTMGGLSSLPRANPDPWGVVRQPVSWQRSALDVIRAAPGAASQIVEWFSKRGMPTPSPDRLAKMIESLDVKGMAAQSGRSPRGIPTSEIAQKQRPKPGTDPTQQEFSGLDVAPPTAPSDPIHMRYGKNPREVIIPGRDVARLENMQTAKHGGAYAHTHPSGGPMSAVDATTQVQYPKNMIYPILETPGARGNPKFMDQLVKRLTQQLGREPGPGEVEAALRKIPAERTIDVLGFPKGSQTSAAAREAVVRVPTRLEEQLESGRIAEIAELAGKTGPLKNVPQSTLSGDIRRLMLGRMAEAPGLKSNIDIMTLMTPERSKNLAALEKQAQTKKLRSALEALTKELNKK